MRTVVFVAPFPAEATIRFARAYSQLSGVRLIGVVQEPPRGERARPFAGLVRVDNALDVNDLRRGIEKIRNHFGGLHQIVGVSEPLQVPRLRTAAAPGASSIAEALKNDSSREP